MFFFLFFDSLMKLMKFKHSALSHVFFLLWFSSQQLLSIYSGEWEAFAFSAPSVGVWDAVSTALTSCFNLTCLNKQRCYSNDETLYYTPSNRAYFISPYLSLERCGKLHWLNLTWVKIKQWHQSKLHVAAMNATKREDFMKKGALQPQRTDRISKYGSKIPFPASRRMLERVDPS